MKKKLRKSLNAGQIVICLFLPSVLVIAGCDILDKSNGEVLITAAEKPAEGNIEAFMDKPFFRKHFLSLDTIDGGVRFPIITVGVDGTVLAFWGHPKQYIRRSEDGGISWEDPIEFPVHSYFNPNVVVDETTGDILKVSLKTGNDILWRSSDHGKTWKEEEITIKPNEVMKWLDRTGMMKRVSYEGYGNRDDGYWLRTDAGESGITLRYGENQGRLLMYAAFRPHSHRHPSDRDPAKAIYSTAIYSDDGGSTWQVSGLFPEGYTEEAAMAELHEGSVYYNSRSHRGYYDKSFERELRPDEALRREAWSYDGGETWEDLNVSNILPDGGGYGRGYGMLGGLVRLPVKNRDIFLYSNTDTGGGDRVKMTVWASFDGGETWPVKRLVYPGPSAYSSLAAGRPGTPGEGYIYLGFEGAETHRYDGIQIARFNLSWLLEGVLTGDGEVPNLENWQ